MTLMMLVCILKGNVGVGDKGGDVAQVMDVTWWCTEDQ